MEEAPEFQFQLAQLSGLFGVAARSSAPAAATLLEFSPLSSMASPL